MTSLVNLFEAPTATLQEKLHLSRGTAVAVIGVVGLAVGLCIQGIVSGWMDVCSIYACPIGALLAGVFFYWVLKKEDCLVQVNLARRRSCWSGGATPCGSSALPWETPPAWAWSAAGE